MATLAQEPRPAVHAKPPKIGDRQWIVPAAILVFCQYFAALSLSRAIGFGGRPPILSYVTICFLLSLAAGIVILLAKVWRLWREKEERPIARLGRETDFGAVACYFIGFQLVALQIGALTWLKQMLPWAIPFWADPALASFDRAIFGSDAWRLVPEALVPALDRIYMTWIPSKTIPLIAILCLRPSMTKAHAMLAYFFILGLMGVSGQYLLSSGGPVFYDRLVGGNEFADLIARINSHAPIASGTSNYLWNAYIFHAQRLGTGISAMPSIHVATTTWIALSLSAFIPKLRWVAWTYWLAIFVSSFALGWHYFSDSVVGTAGAVICWIVAGKVVAANTFEKGSRRLRPRPAPVG